MEKGLAFSGGRSRACFLGDLGLLPGSAIASCDDAGKNRLISRDLKHPGTLVYLHMVCQALNFRGVGLYLSL